MERSVYLTICIVFLSILFPYLLNTPVPETIAEPWKYRSLVASSKITNLMIATQRLFYPHDFVEITTLRALTSFISWLTAKKSEPGSKFQATFTTFDGIGVRLYEPVVPSNKSLPAIIYLHGGGMCLGHPDFFDGLTRYFADELHAVVVSVDYHLAPQNPFPAPFDSSLRASKWFVANAAQFGVDPERIAIAGDSAGGYLAALVTQFIADDDTLPDLKQQVLIYPVMQAVEFNNPSMQKYEADFGLDGIMPRAQVAKYVMYHVLGAHDEEFFHHFSRNTHTSPAYKNHYDYYEKLGHWNIPEEFKHPSYYQGPTNASHGDERVWDRVKDVILDRRFSPLNRNISDFNGVAPAYVLTCGFDSLRDEAIYYIQTLRRAGVEVEWKHYEDAFHGIMWLSPSIEFELGVQMKKDVVKYLKDRL